MRITESLLMSQLASNNDTSSTNFQDLEQELATGLKINKPSDDPSGTNQDMTIRAILVDINQYQTNATSANSFLSYTDSALNGVTNLLQSARTTAVAAASGGTNDASSNAAYAEQIQTAINQMTTFANSDYAGRYIFSGQKTDTPPYIAGDATHAYQGDAGSLTATIGKNNTQTINVSGNQVFAPIFSALEQLKTDITGQNAAAVSNTDLPALDSALSNLGQMRATLGSTIQSVNSDTQMLNTSQSNYQTSLGSIQDADIASTYAALQVAQNVYQASLVTTSRALQYSLAQYLH